LLIIFIGKAKEMKKMGKELVKDLHSVAHWKSWVKKETVYEKSRQKWRIKVVTD
jgi:transcription elongation factor GreA-like protein